MKTLGLAALTAYFAGLNWMWLRDWRQGKISRSPAFRTIYKKEEPGRFKAWTLIHGAILCAFCAILIFAWWALFTGNLK